MKEYNLKPCPFCGSEAIYETYTQEYAYGTKNPEIFCNTCKAIFSIEDDSPYMNCDEDYKYRKEKTKEAWNRRVKSERKKGRWIPMFNGTYYKCSECGYVRMKGDDNFCKECGADMRGDNDG